MILSEAIEVLQKHQQWRQGCDETPSTEPKELTAALEEALVWLRGIRDADEFIRKMAYMVSQKPRD